MANKKVYDFSQSSEKKIYNLTKQEILKHRNDHVFGTRMSIINDILVKSKKVDVIKHRSIINEALQFCLSKGYVEYGLFHPDGERWIRKKWKSCKRHRGPIQTTVTASGVSDSQDEVSSLIDTPINTNLLETTSRVQYSSCPEDQAGASKITTIIKETPNPDETDVIPTEATGTIQSSRKRKKQMKNVAGKKQRV